MQEKKYFYFIIIGDFFKSALPIRCVGMGLHSIAIFVARTSRLNCGLCSLKSAVFVIIGTLQMPFACFKNRHTDLIHTENTDILWHRGVYILCKAYQSRDYHTSDFACGVPLVFNIFDKCFKTV